MIFWPGIMGEFMKYLPITLVVTLTSSLFVALVINPALAAYFHEGQARDTAPTGPGTRCPSAVGGQGEQPVEVRGSILQRLQSLSGICAAASGRHADHFLCRSDPAGSDLAAGRRALKSPWSFSPNIDPNAAYINIDPPEGADLDYIDRIVQKVEMVAGRRRRWMNPDRGRRRFP